MEIMFEKSYLKTTIYDEIELQLILKLSLMKTSFPNRIILKAKNALYQKKSIEKRLMEATICAEIML